MVSQEKRQSQHKLSRRQFLGVTAAAGATVALSGCDLVDSKAGTGWLPTQYHAPAQWPAQVKGRVPIDPANPSIIRRDDACILCGQCLEVCQMVESVYGSYELPIKDQFICIHCGQCSLWCPTGAIQERDDTAKVLEALADPDKYCVIQTAPSTRVGLGEEFGEPMGAWVEGKQIAALKQLGFDDVVDTNFASDGTIMEEGSELLHRLTTGGVLPQFTSCCPGWIKFAEYFYPDLLPNISTVRSPMAMAGPMVKTWYAQKNNIDPEKIVMCGVFPCVAKKFEATRPEMNASGRYYNKEEMRDQDIVISVRELAKMIKQAGIDWNSLDNSTDYDNIMGKDSGGALIFGNTGGVMEAAVRSAYFLVTGENLPPTFEFTAVRGLDGVKEAAVDIPGFGEFRCAVASGLANARLLCEEVRAGKSKYHFIEIMACPGGCIAGGGQPRTTVPPQDNMRQERINSVYEADVKIPNNMKASHQNPDLQMLYEDMMGGADKIGCELAEELFHTHYTSRAEALDAKQG